MPIPISRFVIVMTLFFLLAAPAHGQDAACRAEEKHCMLEKLESMTAAIEERSWRDQTYRELAKLFVHNGQNDKAIALIGRIESPDKKAMTVRAIGIEAAQLRLTRPEYNDLFAALRAEAEKIDHPPSYAIALNYIADAQALSGDDESALKTAREIENSEMRNKALYDSAKIQAEEIRIEAAIAGIEAMNDPGFKNKAWHAVSKIRTNAEDYDTALMLAEKIDNDYLKAQAVLYIMAKQITPGEVSLVK